MRKRIEILTEPVAVRGDKKAQWRRNCEAENERQGDAPDVLTALRDLVAVFQRGENTTRASAYDVKNPYTRAEVKAALKAIQNATGYRGDWTDANNDHLKQLAQIKGEC